MKNTPYFSYREATSMTELEPLLRLRYQVFKEEKTTKALFPDNELGIEIDYFDLKSRHFGIYLVKNGQPIPVGYQRIIHETETPIARTLRSWAARHPLLLRKLSPVNSPLYLMTVNRSRALWEFYMEQKATGVNFVEVSGAFVLKEFRSTRLDEFLLDACSAVNFLDEEPGAGLTSCSKNQAYRLQRFGWRKIAQSDYVFGKTDCCLLQLNPSNFHHQERAEMENMAEAFQATGSVCLHPVQPHYYYPPAYFSFTGLTAKKFLPAMLRAAHPHRPMTIAS